MIRTGHVIAALVGIVLVAWAQSADPTFPAMGGKLPTVLWSSLFFGLCWECIVRLSRILNGLLTGKRAE